MVAQDYLSSRYFTGLAVKTQAEYRKLIPAVLAKWGEDPVAALTKPMAARWYEDLLATGKPRMAQALLRMASILFAHAEVRGWRAESSNPCAKLRMATPAPRARVVTWAEYDALLDAAQAQALPSMGAAITLSYLAGQRETDVYQARRGDFTLTDMAIGGVTVQVWVWSLVRSKRKTTGSITLHDEAAPVIAAILARPAPADAFLLVEERVGRPYDEHLFAKRWAEVRARAAEACPSILAQGDALQFRDLRRSFGAHARRAGASREDVGGVLGNSAATDPRLERTYMPPDLVTTHRAVQAVQRPAKPVSIERKKG
jgi:integrase